jgi:uncharacterized Fe-S cluster protein YjdI
MKSLTKKYTNGEVTIIWQNDLCSHSTICWKHATGLPKVFNPAERPWIKPEGSSTESIIEQVNKCPSGALSYIMNNVTQPEQQPADATIVESIIEIAPNGPLLVYGNVTIKDMNGNETKKSKVTALCRCGASSNKPYCDGTHKKIGYEG